MNSNDPLKIKTSPVSYFLCLFLAFLSTATTFALWITLSFGIILNSNYYSTFLESKTFIEKHNGEHLVIRLCHILQQLLEKYFILATGIFLLACILLVVLMWFASKRNSYVFVKFQSAVTATTGLLLILLPVLALVLKIPSSVRLINVENTMLFTAYLKSSCFVIIAAGVVLLAIAVMEEVLATTIAKNRNKTYERILRETDADNIDM